MKLWHASCGVLLLSSAAFAQGQARQPEIWFGGVDPVVQKDRHIDYPADFMELFQPRAPWAVAASGTQVFKISTQFILRGTEDQIRTLVVGLRQRHIALGVELGLLEARAGDCGAGSEGYGSPLAVEALAKRLSGLGGQLDYVDMDEPITWGHSKPSEPGKLRCQASVESLVDQTLPKIAVLQRYFPQVRIGMIDAVNSRLPAQNQAIIAFIDRLHGKGGFKLTHFHADVAWNSAYLPLLADLMRRLRARGIRVGVDFDGDLEAKTDASWIASALDHYRLTMNDPATRADDLIFGTWSPLPHRMLPETDPAAWTYALRAAVLDLRR